MYEIILWSTAQQKAINPFEYRFDSSKICKLDSKVIHAPPATKRLVIFTLSSIFFSSREIVIISILAIFSHPLFSEVHFYLFSIFLKKKHYFSRTQFFFPFRNDAKNIWHDPLNIHEKQNVYHSYTDNHTLNLSANRTFARWRHLTTTTRMHFATIFVMQIVSRMSDSSQKKKYLINQSVSQLYLSVIGENLALLLIGDTITIDITDLTDLKKWYYITNPMYNSKIIRRPKCNY